MTGASSATAPQKAWFVYLIECVDGSIYTGIAIDVEARFAAHLSGKGARYTRSHRPVRLLAAEIHPDRSSASKAEYRIKQFSVGEKRAYVDKLRSQNITPAPPGSAFA